MNFKTYDILSSLIPGFLILLAILYIGGIKFDKDLTVPYTAVAFLFGYLINTIGSWLEGFYNWTWGGQPSVRLLSGKDIPKIRFYESNKATELLKKECNDSTADYKKLFSAAMRYANGNSRVDDFNSVYAFSRALLTTGLITFILLLVECTYCNLWMIGICASIVVILWIRCKQRSYYYSREVLNVFLKAKG